MKTVEYSKLARKFLNKIPGNDKEKIQEKINQYATDPESLKNNVKKLQGSDYYRLRIGDYRVVFSETIKILYIERIGNRGNIYNMIN